MMSALVDWLSEPWPWYVAGPIIGLTIPFLLIFGNKALGISSSMRHMCALASPVKAKYFSYDWKKGLWNLIFALGLVMGAFIGKEFLENDAAVQISDNTISDLRALGITDFSTYVPNQIFSWENLFSGNGWLFIVVGGLMIGFGTRYAEGCTSGHSIMGMSSLQWTSLVATCGFFIGGLIMTHFILPLIF